MISAGRDRSMGTESLAVASYMRLAYTNIKGI